MRAAKNGWAKNKQVAVETEVVRMVISSAHFVCEHTP
jgi:hypothetical protein